MLRRSLLYLSRQPRIFAFVRDNTLAKRFASRFVAGETIDDAVRAVRDLNAKGISATMDLLGESVANAAEAAAVADEYRRLLDRLHAERLNANVSVKLTAMGQDISDEVCLANIGSVLERARAHDSFVRLDMESSAYTERTLQLFHDRLYRDFPAHVGIVLQSYLLRTATDVEAAIEWKCRVRLCKGAYREPPTVAFPAKSDVDANYVRCAQRLLTTGNYPGLATHDEKIIATLREFVSREAIPPDRFEFQMLYGVRRDLQERLVREGFRVRVYVPYGTHWYPYLMRRLAERPANVMFILGNIIRETVGNPR
ncbi:MAG: proline dehydrogenase family protein [Gemmatimonadaceae bacterium]